MLTVGYKSTSLDDQLRMRYSRSREPLDIDQTKKEIFHIIFQLPKPIQTLCSAKEARVGRRKRETKHIDQTRPHIHQQQIFY